MMRAGVAVLLTVLITGVGPVAAADDPPHAHQRLDRVAAALAKDPLFVDPDVSGALDKAERARVRQAVQTTAKKIGTAVYVVVIPNPNDSESQGRDDAFLFALHDRSRRDGLYLMVSSHGRLESEAFQVPRDYDFSPLDKDEPGSSRPADYDRPYEGLAERIVQRLNGYAVAPSASPSTPRLYSSPDPFGEENKLTPSDPEVKGPLLTGLLLAGPPAAVLLYWAGIGVLALVRRGRPGGGRSGAGEVEKHPRAPRKPGMRWLRRTASKELGRLRDLLATAEAERGRDFAVSAYDAGQILYDDAKDDADRAIDLAGAIVLARRGRAALTRNVASPPVPCLVNPLHGDSTGRAHVPKLDGDGVLPKPCPLCGACQERERRGGLRRHHLMEIGGRPHTAVPGVWRDTAWGANGKKFLPRVMRYLGVE
ncbi:hypothetical protein E1264_06705 [Actinomadura sp. KC216]|uniref:hypothetical protein n=1 Tax=Actinomadura sp. KC216 TaxID=2530370 RepID=UPI00104D47FA|nr:hypothetical protein [Actinomadura sp. KC216]TDB89896.1 hypothetical protein E1264_06705 [Actinomadura sp. KC216]